MNNKPEVIKKRARLLQVLRNFFHNRDYLEVETPVLSPFLLPEPAIEAFKTEYINGYGRNLSCYLIPSPEVWMKRLLAKGYGNIFQITKCFRNGESMSNQHNPEFTMCEWYSVDSDYMTSLAFTEELFLYLSKNIDIKPVIDVNPPFVRLSMKDAFSEYLKIDLDDLFPSLGKHPVYKELDIRITEESTEEEIFNKLFLTFVEPNLPKNKPVILYDYPDCIPVLAKKKGDSPYFERWELYIGGKEIANCYTEETDREKIRDFIKKESKRKKNALVRHKVDKDFPAIFSPTYPDCSGVALGVDRLFMTISGINSIEGVILFPFSSIMEHR